ncbi:hypothetical protein CPB83DRAFT_833652 [Crepidotus variabilis]|uniref:Uncharacterized protein n=1 Tax=Crepidotus variabilis TaxID=179855 RepID=A0A9P6EMC3_9AGAR|nr:hypothetical protein CPB83DRAFT_833652 [Crepidotus variabilis]
MVKIYDILDALKKENSAKTITMRKRRKSNTIRECEKESCQSPSKITVSMPVRQTKTVERKANPNTIQKDSQNCEKAALLGPSVLRDEEFPAFPLDNVAATALVDVPLQSISHQSDEDQVMQDLLANQAAGDEDEEDPRNVVRRFLNRPTKTESENLIHSLIRDYLIEKSLYVPGRKITEGIVLPFPDPSDVNYYENRAGQGGGPTLSPALYAWDKPKRHSWNVRLARLLTSDFNSYLLHKGQAKSLKLIELHRLNNDNLDSDYSLLDSNSSELVDILKKLGEVEEIILNKLDATAQRFKKAATQRREYFGRGDGDSTGSLTLLITRELESKRVTNRRGERRRGLYIRRHMIIEEQVQKRGQDTTNWSLIQGAFAHLEDGDMSSDETETEKGFYASKVVRRRKKMWINPEVSSMLHFVDQHYNPRTASGTLKKGSAPLKREITHGSCNSVALPRPKLPFNIYNVKELGLETVRTLQPKEPIILPEIYSFDDPTSMEG